MTKRLLQILAVATALGGVWSGVAEEMIPTGYPVTRYAAIWEDSPFEREVAVAVETQITSNFGRNFVLEGLVNDAKRGPMAFLRDTKENTPFIVTNSLGAPPYALQIVSADSNADPTLTKVTITDGSETAEIGFEENALTKKIQSPRQQTKANPNDRSAAATAAARAREERKRDVSGSLPQPIAPNSPLSDSDEAAQDGSETDPLNRLDDPPRRRSVPLPKGIRN